jgi:hypothetical protein
MVYEVYYDDQGNIKLIAENPARPFGVTITELKNDLKYIRRALNLPILDMDEVLKSFKPGAADEIKKTRLPGSAKGQILSIAPDFDEPLDI